MAKCGRISILMADTEQEQRRGLSPGELKKLSTIWDQQVGQHRMLLAIASSELVDHNDGMLVFYGGHTLEMIGIFNEFHKALGSGLFMDDKSNLYFTGTVKVSPDSESEIDSPIGQTINPSSPEPSSEPK